MGKSKGINRNGPNILLLSIDTLRANRMSLFGYDRLQSWSLHPERLRAMADAPITSFTKRMANSLPAVRAPLFDARTFHMALNRFPLKHGWDALALAQVMLRDGHAVSQKLSALRFYFDAHGIENLSASLPRSGHWWSKLGLAIARDLATGGDGNFVYNNHTWVPRNGLIYTKLDWREAFGETESIGTIKMSALLHTHHPYFRLRSARLKKMKIVILLRDIFESIESNFFRMAKIPDSPDGEDIADFPWEKLTNDAIEFFNSWGDVIRWHPNCLVYRYEELVSDPVGTHKEMVDFWGLDIPEECIAEAFSSITKDKMKAKISESGQEKNLRVSFRSRDEGMPDDHRRLIADTISKKLNFDFGYSVDAKIRCDVPFQEGN